MNFETTVDADVSLTLAQRWVKEGEVLVIPIEVPLRLMTPLLQN